MGGKASKRKPAKKKPRQKMEKTFACPFCHNDACIDMKIDKHDQMGTATCRVCAAGYQTVSNYLTEPIDIYSEWIDAIQAKKVRKQKLAASQQLQQQQQHSSSTVTNFQDEDQSELLNK